MRKILLVTIDNEILSGSCDLEEVIPEITEENENIEDEDEEEDEDDDPLDNEDKSKKKDDDEEEDEEEQTARFTLDQIKTAFKDDPEGLKQAKHAFFREQKFTEIFPTIEDAEKASEAQVAYEAITEAVVSGDTDKFLTQLKDASSDGVKKFAANFFPSLLEMDENLALDVAKPIVKRMINNVYEHSKTLSNENDRKNVAAAAKVVRMILFGGNLEDITSDTGIIQKTKKEETEGDKTKKTYLTKQYNDLYASVTNQCYTKLDEEINAGLKDLDKEKPGLKKILAKQIRNEVLEKMQSDPNYLSRMQGLWKREERGDFSGALRKSLFTTFMAKARTLVVKTRAQARKDALGKEDVSDKKEPNRPGVGRAASGNNKSKMTPALAKEQGLSSLEIFRGGRKE